MPIAIEVCQQHLAATKTAAPLRTTIADNHRFLAWCRTAHGTKEIPLNTGTVGRIEISLASCDVSRGLLINFEAQLYEDQLCALPFGCHRRHRRPNPELARLIAHSSYDAAPFGSAHRDRLALQFRVVPLLH
ncbi:hypothetical protein LMTR13_26280 [Bradyrhizobium icense]|uniref:Uncharacterized protein n=1 Tax=Bradyrhizobium icense TaxID=1274631 RepID=A0A1B1UK98_9BRAD|nr:hypothetical protein LMTR13_26280 [Bradyrhizobium icense]